MKERPILFSAPMVRALLDGRKTQTRRIVKPRKDRELGVPLAPCELAGEVNGGNYDNCPYGAPGDRLWVRETWQFHGGMLDGGAARPTGGGLLYKDLVVSYPAEGARVTLHPDRRDWPTPQQPPQREGEVYSLRDAPDDFRYDGKNTYRDRLTRWWERKIPAIHMFRWASRITLEITNVRVERLHRISELDALAEGVNVHPDHHGNLRGMVVLSGYATDLYAAELQGWQIHTTSARISSGRGTGLRTEVVWLNPACVASLEHAAGGLFAEAAA